MLLLLPVLGLRSGRSGRAGGHDTRTAGPPSADARVLRLRLSSGQARPGQGPRENIEWSGRSGSIVGSKELPFDRLVPAPSVIFSPRPSPHLPRAFVWVHHPKQQRSTGPTPSHWDPTPHRPTQRSQDRIQAILLPPCTPLPPYATPSRLPLPPTSHTRNHVFQPGPPEPRPPPEPSAQAGRPVLQPGRQRRRREARRGDAEPRPLRGRRAVRPRWDWVRAHAELVQW